VTLSPDHRGKILPFRRRPPGDIDRRHDQTEIDRLLDISKYEKPRKDRDEFKARMVENVAALIALGVLIGIATADFDDLEHHEQCVAVLDCSG
jgi:hypothetical protein